jgi:hypothetical protein
VKTSKSVFPISSAAVRPVGGDPARADQQELALQVLEVHALAGSGQQVVHAGELEFAVRFDPGHRTP